MFRIEWVTMTSTISSPEMVVVNLGRWHIVRGHFRWKDLPVEGAILRHYLRPSHVRSKLSRDVRAIISSNHKCWSELYEQSLLQRVAQSIIVSVELELRSG